MSDLNDTGKTPVALPQSVGSAGCEAVIIENGMCDGCGGTNIVQVIENVCLCRGCLEIEPLPNTKMSGQ